ncbi:cadmium-translocating P-type ATPase [Candidatus Bathyarchaeota archaeon]|nr:cadmium-translocating P-type ATPase [Candidatus Bathyarchaeota archaeon]
MPKMRENHTETEECCDVCNIESLEGEGGEKGKEIIFIALSAILLSVGLIFEFILEWRMPAEILFLATAAISGYSIAKEGFSSLIFRRKLSINFLIMIAAAGSFFISHGEEGAAVIFLFYVAEYLESYAGERARKSIASLMELAPEVAAVKRNGKEVKVPVSEVDVNEVIVIRPGEKIPLDGEVIRGVSTVNQAPITGESAPVTKEIGDVVYAGTINNEGFLEVKVTKRSDETMLSKIVKLVEEAQRIKSPTEKFIDRFSKYYTPSVIFLALCVATVPTFVLGWPFNEWLYKALVLLVVSCPCALAISTPVAMVSGITSAARNGVLIKGSAYVEEVNKIKVFAFDKTGTLTEGRLEVTDVVSLKHPEDEILRIAASLETMSEHPIAKAIVEKIDKEAILRDVDDFRAIAGKGVMGRINGETYYVGSRRLFKELSIEYPEEEAWKLESEGKTVIFVGNKKEVIGLVAVMDKIRDSTIPTMAELRRKRIKTIMITGDNERTAKAIAERIGIAEYRAELLPEDKVNIIEELSEEYGHVAMVGDGVNDAPALARASVGIAMGAIGSDVSLETADIALMQDDLSKIPYLIELSNRTLEIVKENVLASILIKGSFAVLVFPGLVTLWLAVAVGDMGLSLAVILNAMRLSLVKSKDLQMLGGEMTK